MKLHRIDIVDAPGNNGRVRLVGEVSYLDHSAREAYWFEVDREFEDLLSRSGNPWLVCLLPLAMTLGERLEIALPVDPLLYEGVQEIMQIWTAWYPDLHLDIVPVAADIVADDGLGRPNRRTAAFFSGGVDSFYTVLRHQGAGWRTALRLDDLILVGGLADIPLADTQAFPRVREALGRAAAELRKRLVAVSTNLRETRWAEAEWERLAHGNILCAIALILEDLYSEVMIAASGTYARARPWGSHHLTDPLFSSSRLRIIHDGASVSRTRKLEQIVHSDIAMRYLRTCWQSGTGENCCACGRCYRTMAALATLGALHRATTFRSGDFRIEKVGRIYLRRGASHPHDLEDLALRTGNRPLAQAVRRSVRYSRTLHRLLPIVRWVEGKRGIGRVGYFLESRLRAGALY